MEKIGYWIGLIQNSPCKYWGMGFGGVDGRHRKHISHAIKIAINTKHFVINK